MSCPVRSSENESNENSDTACPLGYNKDSPLVALMISAPKPPNSPTAAFVDADVNSHPHDITYNPDINDISFGQNTQSDQKVPLSTTRVLSTIPKTDFSPRHQPTDKSVWVYPSEQQYFNAIRRKGYMTQETEIPSTLAIHNSVNEQSWTMIRQWEGLRGNMNPKLKKFMGRPHDISPKARFMTLIGYKPPFDRHDWIIDRNGEDIRYVIDFYTGSKSVGSQVSIHLDVRPAIDSPMALFDRITYFIRRNYFPWKLPRTTRSSNPLEAWQPSTPQPIPTIVENEEMKK